MKSENEKLSDSYLSEDALAKHTRPEQEEAPEIRGESIPKNIKERLFLLYRPFAPLLFVVSIGVFFLVILTTDSEEKKDSLATETEEGNPEAVIELVTGDYNASDLKRELTLREALIEERGGRVFLDSLRSQKMSGTISFDEVENEIFILSMKPNRAIIRILQDDEQLTLGFDGSEFWKVVNSMNGYRAGMETTGLERIILDSLGRINGPLLSQFLEGRGRVISVEQAEDNDLPVIRIAFAETTGGTAGEIDLNPSDLSLLRWERQDEQGDVHIFRYGEYEKFGEGSFPTMIEYWRNGERKFKVDLKTVTPNFGAVQILFQNPLPSDSTKSDQ